MGLTACPECQGKLSTSASRCPHCEYEAFACPECGEQTSKSKEFCSKCGFPIRPARAPAPRKRRVWRRQQQEDPESPAALAFAILGWFIPIFLIIGFVMSKPGTAARIISGVGLFIWLACIVMMLCIGIAAVAR